MHDPVRGPGGDAAHVPVRRRHRSVPAAPSATTISDVDTKSVVEPADPLPFVGVGAGLVAAAAHAVAKAGDASGGGSLGLAAPGFW
jgi:hypothetical protein